MKYPYIGKWKGLNITVLFVANCEGFEMGNTQNHQCDFSEGEYTNITHEFLQNTYGEVVSPEHADFIIELCANNEIKTKAYRYSAMSFFMIIEGELYFYSDETMQIRNKCKKITIPLPPKAEPKIYQQEKLGEAPKHFDCVCNKCGGKCCTGQCDKQESSEWPQVGDEVRWDKNDYTGTVKAISDGNAWCKLNNGLYHTIQIKRIKKPKTPGEELRDDIVWLTVKHMENKSYSIEENAYYLFSDLMGKYKITKKV